MSYPAADIFRRAAQANRADPRRTGNVVALEPAREVVACGDIHGRRAVLSKIIAHASLDARPERRLVLQEVIHGPLDEPAEHDRSVDLLLRAARLKLAHEEAVVFLLGNHDLAQATGSEIAKSGREVCKAFREGVEFAFGEGAAEVAGAIDEFLLSMPLAVRCPNGALLSHSLPSPARMDRAGTEVLDRPWKPEDLRRGGSVYEWTWGRGHTPEQLQELAARLGARYFILGHRHLEAGWEALSPLGVTISSDRMSGVVMEFRSDVPIDGDNVEALLRPIAGLGA